ncbi:Putative sporulation hydrolase CotR [Durusdinium trenchii]|uniref:Sporulation hydrolase CotR n=1 Tax=Durusdinium trenchii TaxID=1381693 RepID=A0ABP0Q1E6_9DINO
MADEHLGELRKEWWDTVVGPSKSRYRLRDRVHQGLLRSRKRVQSVTDNTWDTVNVEFQRIQELRTKLKEEFKVAVRDEMVAVRDEFDHVKASVRDEFDHVKTEAENKVRSIWWSAPFYIQLLGFVAPPLVGFYNICKHYPFVVGYGVVYLICLILFLLWSLVVPSMSQRGVNLFSPYEFSAEEALKIQTSINNAAERSAKVPQQGLWKESDRGKPTFVLSLDGGGIKGAVSARVLTRICDEFPDLMDRVDLIAGCSTGTILGGMLATGFSPAEVTEMFEVASPLVFRTTVWEQLKNLGMLTGPNHDGEGKLKILQHAFRGLSLGELPKGICFTASHVQDDRCAPRVWTNVVNHSKTTYVGHHEFSDDEFDDEDFLDEEVKAEQERFSVLDMKLADIVNGATAAPLYFPSFNGHVDGGLWSNDPAMAALAVVSPVRDLENVCLLSIGTGLTEADETCEVGPKWGLKQWLPWLVDFLFFSTAKATQFNCKAMLGRRYHRLDPILPNPVALNDVSAIDELIEAANRADLEPTLRFLEKRLGLKRKSA